MTDISKHPLLKACYEACLAVEKLGASPDQTDAVSRVSDMMRPIEALVDDLTVAQAELAKAQETIQQQARELEEAKTAIEIAEEWMAPQGCDCGTDEPGTCGLCLVEAFLARHSARAQQSEAKKEE